MVLKSRTDSKAVPPQSELQETGMCDVPLSLNVKQLSVQDRKMKFPG
jgi:hypothetical protein